jgi:hypothetical protein
MYRRAKSILPAMKGKALTLIKLMYNIILRRANVGFIDSMEEWTDNHKSMTLPFQCHPNAWYRTFMKESELFNLDKRFYDRREFRLLNELRWRLVKEVKIYYLSLPFIIGENAVVMAPDRRIFKQLTYPASGRWRYDEFFRECFLPSVNAKEWVVHESNMPRLI